MKTLSHSSVIAKDKSSACHARASQLLREAGWSPLRDFSPIKADRIGADEHFEMWRNEVGNRRVIVHFYSEGNGCDFYECGNENTWASVEALLAEEGK